MCLLICSARYTASFVPRRQETISKSNCPSAACLNAAGTVLLAFPSISPGVIPSRLIPVNVELAGTWTLVNPQLSWRVGQVVTKPCGFLSFVSESTYWSSVRGLKGEVPVGRQPACSSVGTSQLFQRLSEAVKHGRWASVV